MSATRLTRPLQGTVALCSLIFAIGSTLHGVAVVDVSLIETMMRMAGSDDPEASAPGFTTTLLAIGVIYIVGNAIGVLAWWSRSGLLWWWILAVNVTQGAGYFMIPPQMWTAATDRYGVIGVLPSLITDGGAALLALFMLGTMLAFRTTWAQRRSITPDERPIIW